MREHVCHAVKLRGPAIGGGGWQAGRTGPLDVGRMGEEGCVTRELYRGWS